MGIATVDIAAKAFTRHAAKADGDSVAIMRGDDTGADVSMTGMPRSTAISAITTVLGIAVGVGVGAFVGNMLAAVGGGLIAGAVISNHGESLTHHGTISNYLGFGDLDGDHNVVNLSDIAVVAGALLATGGIGMHWV